jgi:hypothetical protein
LPSEQELGSLRSEVCHHDINGFGINGGGIGFRIIGDCNDRLRKFEPYK